ncbi:unnamed protein product [Rhizopus stolonifer]
MEENNTIKYAEKLEALEKQRESLELVMLKMGEEWEESGAGIGWMRDDKLENITAPSDKEPSHDYLQSLLNVNDQLLAQSLASLPSYNTQENDNNTCPLLSSMISPLSENGSLDSPKTPTDVKKQ